MLVVAPDRDPVLLDFFVEAPGREADPAARAPLVPVDVSFGDVVQVFHIGASAAGTYGTPSGICAASQRFGTVPLADLAKPAAALARDGVEVTAEQAYVFEILAPIEAATAESRALFMPGGPSAAARASGSWTRELGDALERLAAEGAEPFYTGEIAERGVRVGRRPRRHARRRRPRRLRHVRPRADPRRPTTIARRCSTRRRARAGS